MSNVTECEESDPDALASNIFTTLPLIGTLSFGHSQLSYSLWSSAIILSTTGLAVADDEEEDEEDEEEDEEGFGCKISPLRKCRDDQGGAAACADARGGGGGAAKAASLACGKIEVVGSSTS